MAGLLGALCGWRARPEEHYEMIRGAVPPTEAEPRLKEALTVVNALLPAPITLDDALESLDETRRLVKARTLARTYHNCMVNLERLSRHQPNCDAPSLDGAVAAHREKMRRLADTCMATILQMYMSVGSSDKSADVLVSQAIRSMAESEVVMEDVAIAEKALGLQTPVAPKPQSSTPPSPKVSLPADPQCLLPDLPAPPAPVPNALPPPKPRTTQPKPKTTKPEAAILLV
ncbi:tegument protein UL51 [Pteropodid alphaherpesvirus 1]|uniref:Tegument protein UL51 n=1 Tax=Pteropodid alphaherpesvirus 1 TaxID=1343901 RepID=A0A060Q5A5_9ALPH|nr:tegument protein UL51 [Pteropodid alphaherpesvirus 1]BAP00731.1 tegument protein UL51 [Pteropodid alphaherpesvirus 1]